MPTSPIANSYFSGAGLMDIGLQRGGLGIQQSFEFEPVCCETQRLNFAHEVVTCNLREKLAAAESPCDVMIATYPCKKYSPIADIHGTRTGEDLFLHFSRHIALREPEAYVVENVPGMRRFPVVMEAMTQLPTYFVNVFCPIGTQTWLPQRRDRLIIIGSRGRFDWRPPEAGRRVTLAEILEDNPRVEIPDYVAKRSTVFIATVRSSATRPAATSRQRVSRIMPRTFPRASSWTNGFLAESALIRCANMPSSKACPTTSFSPVQTATPTA